MGVEEAGPAQQRSYVRVSVDTIAYRDIPLIAWSGSVIASMVKEALKSYQRDSPGEIELVSVSPIFTKDPRGSGRERPVISGVVENRRIKPVVVNTGARVTFSFLVRIPRMFQGNVLRFLDVFSETLGRFGLQPYSYGFEFLEETRGVESVGEANKYLIEISYCPTIFVFRGWRILYPSPSRLVHSLARNYALIAPSRSRELKKKAHVLSRYVELVRDNCKIVTLNIGRDRRVKVFLGTAVYGVYGSVRARELIALLHMGSKLNVGKSRGIGFGSIRLESIKLID